MLRGGEGTLEVGFHLDPLYHVHWNNLTKPVKYEITGPDGTTISPAKGEGPKVKEPSDIDPREFLVEIKRNNDSAGPLQLTMRYFACNDEEGWCKPVTQQYAIYLQRDRDGGSVRSRGGGRGGRLAGGGSFDRNSIFNRMDANGDGKLTKDELPEFARERLEEADKDGDGVITKDEFAQSAPSGRGGGRAGFGGGFGGPGRRGGFGGPGGADFAARIMSNDKNGDGKVTKDELPESMQRILDRADTNNDGAIDKEEAQGMAERFGGGGRPGGFGRGKGARPKGARPKRPN